MWYSGGGGGGANLEFYCVESGLKFYCVESGLKFERDLVQCKIMAHAIFFCPANPGPFLWK